MKIQVKGASIVGLYIYLVYPSGCLDLVPLPQFFPHFVRLRLLDLKTDSIMKSLTSSGDSII
jgi:hypothetical protein